MQSATEAEPQLLTVRQVQELLHIDRSTIYRMASDGRLPAIRVGKQLRFPSRDIAALVNGAADVDDTSPAPDPAAATAAINVAAGLLDVMMVVTDMSGRPITPIVHACPEFEARASEPNTLAACLREWRSLAEDTDLAPRFRPGRLGFECARAFIRNGTALVGMVLVGGVAPAEATTSPESPSTEAAGSFSADGLTHLSAEQRARVIAALPLVARAISDAVTGAALTRHLTPTSPEPGA
jgi:excisionase family DNA binding protein